MTFLDVLTSTVIFRAQDVQIESMKAKKTIDFSTHSLAPKKFLRMLTKP